MPTTTSFEFGSVVLVPFPVTDQTSTKKRHAIVVSSDAYYRERPDIIIMTITSQPNKVLATEYRTTLPKECLLVEAIETTKRQLEMRAKATPKSTTKRKPRGK